MAQTESYNYTGSSYTRPFDGTYFVSLNARRYAHAQTADKTVHTFSDAHRTLTTQTSERPNTFMKRPCLEHASHFTI